MFGAARFDMATDWRRCRSLVGIQNAGMRQLSQKFVSRRAIGKVAAGRQGGDRTPIAIGKRLDFSRSPADRFIGQSPSKRERFREPVGAPRSELGETLRSS